MTEATPTFTLDLDALAEFVGEGAERDEWCDEILSEDRPGESIFRLVESVSLAIRGPKGWRILVRVLEYPYDLDAVLVEVETPDRVRHSLYGQDWDRFASPSLFGPPTLTAITETVQAVIAEANRVCRAMALPSVDDLAAEIRRADGDHTLSAAALAEAVLTYLRKEQS